MRRPHLPARKGAAATSDVEQVARGSGEPVKPRHHQHITLVQPSQEFRKVGPVSTGTAGLLRPRRDRALSGSDAVEKLSD